MAGERVALLIGCTPPSGWSVALRRSEVSGGRPTKGLVPATYVQLLPFEVLVVMVVVVVVVVVVRAAAALRGERG